MFNKIRIQELENRVEFLQQDRRELRDEIWRLEKDLARLMAYLKVTFVNVNTRQVQAVIPKSEEV